MKKSEEEKINFILDLKFYSFFENAMSGFYKEKRN